MGKAGNRIIGPNLSLVLTITPLDNFTYSSSHVLGEMNVLFIKHFYSKTIAQKIYVILCELLNNVVDHTQDKSSECRVFLAINQESAVIKVKNKTNKDRYEKVKNHIKEIQKIKNKKSYLADIMNKRREQGKTGGLGLLRLFIENTKKIGISYNKKNSYMTVIATLFIRSTV